MNTVRTITIHDIETGETITREMTAEELDAVSDSDEPTP